MRTCTLFLFQPSNVLVLHRNLRQNRPRSDRSCLHRKAVSWIRSSNQADRNNRERMGRRTSREDKSLAGLGTGMHPSALSQAERLENTMSHVPFHFIPRSLFKYVTADT